MNTRLLLPLTALVAGALACAFPAVTLQPPSAAPTTAPSQNAPVTTGAATTTNTTSTTSASVPSVAVQTTATEEQALIDLYARVNPAVVSIRVSYADGTGAQGSGFLYDTGGHIVTNQHVVDGAQFVEVDFPGGLKTEGKVVGTDADTDLAVIKVEQVPDGVSPLTLADSNDVQVGQSAVAIGNPFGEAGSMSLGIISGKGRTLSDNRSNQSTGHYTSADLLQTDAPINPGNSGGPLLNLSGQVIGINRAIATESGSGSGVGYAIPSNAVSEIVPALISSGHFTYPYLGLSSAPELTLQSAQQLGLAQTDGAYVVSVVANGPAAKAGLKGDTATARDGQLRGDGDLIVAVDGQPVHVFADLIGYLDYNKRPGDSVTLTVLRQNQRVDLTVTLGERPQS